VSKSPQTSVFILQVSPTTRCSHKGVKCCNQGCANQAAVSAVKGGKV